MTVDKDATRVQRMFGEIAGRYDLLNRLLSMGIDRSWRRRAVKLSAVTDGPVLDVCTGTADLALEYLRRTDASVRIVASDFCRPMLDVATDKVRRAKAPDRIELLEADLTALPLADDRFEVVSVAFGLRNVSGTDRALAEMVRVCRPGGRVVVLEFTMPRGRLIGPIYRGYFRFVLPRIGQALSSNCQSAYNYLPESVGEFPQYEALVARMESAGLERVRFVPMTFGIATVYVGRKG